MNLILLHDGEVDPTTGIAELRDQRATHLRTVLRAHPDRTVRVGMVDGPCGIATVLAVTPGLVRIHCAFEDAPPERPPVDLLLALPRPKVLRRLWAQLAALGVGRVVLTNAAKVERNYFDTHLLEEQIYRPLLIEGLQQARDTRVPLVSIHRQFRKLVEDDLDLLCPQAVRLAADPVDARSPRDAARTAGDSRVLLAVGPEGGWNAFELDLLAARGFERVSLGPRTLRTDTACVALLSLVHDGLARGQSGGIRDSRFGL